MARSRVTRWLKTSVWADRLLAVIALSPVGVLLVRQFMELSNHSVPCCDFAALELGTRAFLRGEQFVGLYSREGWRHPGPAPFLWSSLFRPLPGRSFAEHQIGSVLLALLAMGTVIAATWKRTTVAGRSVIIALVAVFILRFDIDAFRVPWNPYGAMLWSVVAVMCTAVFVQTRSPMWVGCAVLSGSMAAQTHVGAAPTVAVCFVTIAVILFRSRHQRDSSRRIWTAGVMFAVLWFLPLADLAFGNRNLLKIIRPSTASSAAMDRSDVLTGLMWILGNSPGRIGVTFGPRSPFVDVREIIVLDIVAIVAILGLAAVAMVRWRSDRFTGTLAAIASSSAVLTGIALVVSPGPYLRYLMLPMAGLGLIFWVVAGVTLVRLLQRHERNVIKILVWPAVLTMTVFSILGIDTRRFTNSYENAQVQSVVETISESCSSLPQRSIVEIGEGVEWFDALPVIVALDRCVTVRVLGHVGFLAGQPYQAEDGSIPNVQITASPSSSASAIVARSDLLTVSTANQES